MLLVRTTTAYGAVDAYQRARHVRLYGDIHDGWSTNPGQASQGEFWSKVLSKALANAPGDDSALRHTGIGFMGDIPWGTHVCLFHEPPRTRSIWRFAISSRD
jgi:hypothetical protein